VKEIQAMAARGRIIGPGVLERLHEQTEPLAQAVTEGGLNVEDLERVNVARVGAEVDDRTGVVLAALAHLLSAYLLEHREARLEQQLERHDPNASGRTPRPPRSPPD
jgi:hypothetical protein